MPTEVSQLRSDADDNRDRILAAARLACTAEGLSVPIREIARRAQVGTATVYRRFPTKQALFTAAFAEEMSLCSTVVDEGLAASDPWRGLSLTIEKLLTAYGGDARVRAILARLSRGAESTAVHDRTVRGLLELIRRAKASGQLRSDVVLEDIVLAMQASHGVRATSPTAQAAATRRLAALIIDSFRATPDATPLPPPGRLPLRA
ncbi:TetR/AcrR family transcriptional regulator [Streptomyces profundus]|uniref:TetR/AcrR family transcriptional regulator n=1 Tax=Streptomyces profundus TaxID=2867410 RepID=UPI001D161D85|nr:TetR/AcrR family transcriptional regulator [Streptomyces sp. MA3_2.13]UED84079.1 TetR/AcrR family transcriptional regulator [Streptomyces sp. MA3_2.13]